MIRNRLPLSKQAFSLIEILIAVIIVGVVASIALSQYGNVVEKAKAQEGEQILYAVMAVRRGEIVEKPPGSGGSLTKINYLHSSANYYSQLGMIENSSSGTFPGYPNSSCTVISVFRKGDYPVMLPFGCGGGSPGSGSSQALYALSLEITSTGTKNIYCRDNAARPMCYKLGYSYSPGNVQLLPNPSIAIP